MIIELHCKNCGCHIKGDDTEIQCQIDIEREQAYYDQIKTDAEQTKLYHETKTGYDSIISEYNSSKGMFQTKYKLDVARWAGGASITINCGSEIIKYAMFDFGRYTASCDFAYYACPFCGYRKYFQSTEELYKQCEVEVK